MGDKKVMKLDEAQCSVCKNDFLTPSLDAMGRCTVCASQGLTPGTKAKQDYIQSDAERRDELKVLIREVLQEIKDEESEAHQPDIPVAFAPKVCKVCGKEFIPRAPAQSRCDECLADAKNSK